MTVAEAVSALGSEVGATIGAARVAGTERIAERTAGLDAARQAFDLAGATGLEVLGHEADGRARWPEGWTGSISHAGGVAVAAVTPTAERRGIGIDIEEVGALDPTDAELVLDPSERAAVAAAADPAALATLIWSAKEAAFKAWSNAGGGMAGIDPVEIHVEIDPASRLVSVHPSASLVLAYPAAVPMTGIFTTVDALSVLVVTDGR